MGEIRKKDIRKVRKQNKQAKANEPEYSENAWRGWMKENSLEIYTKWK